MLDDELEQEEEEEEGKKKRGGRIEASRYKMAAINLSRKTGLNEHAEP